MYVCAHARSSGACVIVGGAWMMRGRTWATPTLHTPMHTAADCVIYPHFKMVDPHPKNEVGTPSYLKTLFG